jgi:hypothetical protein
MPSGRPVSGHEASALPKKRGTNGDPASLRARCTVTSGFSPWWRVRKSLRMIVGAPSSSTTIEVFDCSPENIRAPVTRDVSIPIAVRVPTTKGRCCAASTIPSSPATSGTW